MRPRRILPVALLVGALALGGCASDDAGSDATATADAGSTSDATDGATDSATAVAAPTDPAISGSDVGFTASGAFGEKPTLTFDSDTAPEGLQVATLSEGDGAEIVAGDFVVAQYLGQIWNTETVFDNSYDRGAPSGFLLDQVIEGWTTGLVGQKVGSRVALTIPAEYGYGPSGGSSDGTISATDTIVFVVDIVGAYDPESVGDADATPTGADVPVTVTGDLGAPITAVAVTDGATEPTAPTVTVIATGSGEALTAEHQALMQYTLAPWDNSGSETTWPSLGGSGPLFGPLSSGSVFEGLIGVPVGSRVLLQVPADATSGQPSLAVVIDVVAAVAP